MTATTWYFATACTQDVAARMPLVDKRKTRDAEGLQQSVWGRLPPAITSPQTHARARRTSSDAHLSRHRTHMQASMETRPYSRSLRIPHFKTVRREIHDDAGADFGTPAPLSGAGVLWGTPAPLSGAGVPNGAGHLGERLQVLQPFSQMSLTPTVATEFQVGLYDPAEADLEHFWNCCSAVRDFWENGCRTRYFSENSCTHPFSAHFLDQLVMLSYCYCQLHRSQRHRTAATAEKKDATSTCVGTSQWEDCRYSRSLKNLARQLLHNSNVSAFTGSQRTISSGRRGRFATARFFREPLYRSLFISTYLRSGFFYHLLYCRSRKNLARQLLHHSYKSASATP